MGRKPGLVHASYKQRVIDRAMQLKMPYRMSRFVSTTIPALQMPLPPSTREKYQEHLAEERLAVAAWKRKYEEAIGKLEEKDVEFEQLKHQLRKQSGTIVAMNIDIQGKNKLLARYANMRRTRESDSEDPPTTSRA